MTHIISGLGTGGAEVSLLRLMEGSPSLRSGAVVISLRDHGTIGARIESAGVPVVSLGLTGRPTLGALWRLRRHVQVGKPEVLQGWMYHGNLAAVAAGALGAPQTPVVWNIRHSVHDLDHEKPATARVIRLCALLSRRPARIIYNSRVSASLHASMGFSTDRAVIIANGFDTETFRPSSAARAAVRGALGIGLDIPLVGMVARYHPVKDHRTFLEAAARLAGTVADIQYLLAGSGVDDTNAELSSWIRELGLEGRIRLLGETSEIPRLMAALDVLGSSSVTEGFPNVVGEAMSAGVPCAVTDVGDSAWLVEGTGRIVPPRDSYALAAAIGELLAMPVDGRRALGEAARARIEREFALQSVMRRYEELYAELAPRGLA